ncbi:MAG: fructosamine kinase family protein, partial [Spirochaetaceae bacterium]|nr:fructosamine kinase family protein [Spirochaetaceae bacterium]
MIENADSLESALEQLYTAGTEVEKRVSVSGGDINRAFIIILSSGEKLFLKENRGDLLPMFSSESEGLLALGSAGGGAPPVPRPLAWGRDGENSFLLMDAVKTGRLDSGEKFGASLALLHRNGRSDLCGFQGENRIGSTPQNNKQMQSWHDFFGEQRLGFQWELTRGKGYGDFSDEKA